MHSKDISFESTKNNIGGSVIIGHRRGEQVLIRNTEDWLFLCVS